MAPIEKSKWARLLDIVFGLALVAAAGVGLFTLTRPWPDTPDGLFHLHRVRALAEALRWGVLYPRWFPDFSFGYGYPVLNFYAPAFYYPPALLHLLGMDVLTATRLALAGFYALSGLAMYVLLRRRTRPGPALVGSVLYQVYPYHLYDLFVRGALPEFVAFLWLPLTAWATLSAMRARPRVGRASALAALAWAGLILTHNLTALMWVPPVAGGILLITWARKRRGGDVVGGMLPIATGFLLAGFYVLPVLGEMRWVGIGATPAGTGYERHFSAWQALFTWDAAYPYPPASQPTVPVPAYVGIILGVGLVALLLARRRRQTGPLGPTVALALFTLWMNTDISAWFWHFVPRLSTLQFPWRWQSILAFAVALLLALILDLVFDRSRLTTYLLYIALIAYFIFYALGNLQPIPAKFSARDITREQMWAFDSEHGQVGASWTAEFLPRWVTEQRWAIGRAPTGPEPTLSTGIKSIWLNGVGYLHLRGTFEASRASLLVFHTFYYPAWEVRVDNRVVPARPISSLGLLAAQVPAGRHTFSLQWKATGFVQAGRGLSALGWLLVFLFLARGGRPRPRPGLLAWGLVGIVLLVGSLNALAREARPRPVAADYGPVVLIATLQSPVGRGMPLRVTLYWFVRQRPEPVTAFVHVVDEAGRVVAQHDGPVAAGYTPVERWLPGAIIPDPHPIRLPANLPPGTYRLKAGLYRPGYADQPLRPVGAPAADPRVDIGTIEVGP